MNRGFALMPVVIGLVLLAGVAVMMSRQGAGLSTAATSSVSDTQVEALFAAARARANWELDFRQCGGYTSRGSMLGGHRYLVAFSAVEGSPVDLTLTAALQDGQVMTRQVRQTQAWDAEQSIQIQSSKSVRINQNAPTINYESNTRLKVGGVANRELRAPIQFDLSSIPTGVRIAAATLVLNVETVGLAGREIGVKRLTESWAEDIATWTGRDLLLTWRTAGGTTAATSYGSFVINTTGTVSVDVTTLVAEWYSGAAPNYGLLLQQISVALGTEADLTSDDAGTNRPRLDIQYRCECGSTCSVDNYAACDSRYRANTESAAFSPALTDLEGAAAVPADFTVAGITFGADGGYVLVDGQVIHGYSATGTLLGSCNVSNSMTGVTYVSAGLDRGSIALVRDNGVPRVDYVGQTCAVQRSVTPTGMTLQNPTGITYLRLEPGHQREHQLALVNAAGLIEFIDGAGASRGTVTPDFAPAAVADIAHVYNQEYFMLLDAGRSEVMTVNLAGHVDDRYDYGRFALADAEALSIDMNTCAHIIGSQQSNRIVSLVRTPLSVEAVAHWKLDESSGVIAADSIGANPATLTGTPAWAPLSGALQGSLLLAGGTQGAQVADTASLDLTRALSLSGWIRPVAHDAGEALVGRRALLNQHQYWLGTASGVPVFRFNDGVERVLAGPAAININAWSHLAATYDIDAGLARLFVNGAPVASVAISDPLRSAPSLVRLGSDTFDDTRASIDDVRIFKGALRDADILTLFQESPAGGLGGGGAPPPPCDSEDLADDFSTVGFAGTIGSLVWGDPWVEVGEGDGAPAGDIRVETAPRALQLRDNDSGGEGVQRKADLSQFTSADLSFNYARFNLEADDYVTVSIGDGSSQWTELGRIQGAGTDDTSNMASMTFNIDSHRQSGRYIRFVTHSGMGDDEGVYIDNVRISGCYP